MEQVLQASMFTHSTLTQGEWVQVQHAGTQHDLKVLALKPAAAVSIIGMATCKVVMGGLLSRVAVDTKRSPSTMSWVHFDLGAEDTRGGGGGGGGEVGRVREGAKWCLYAFKPGASG